MNDDEIYNNWSQQKTNIDIDENFPTSVMKQISAYERDRTKPLFDIQRFVEIISNHPLAKAGLIAAGLIGGFVRTGFVLYAILGC
jgi:hypothetical protein